LAVKPRRGGHPNLYRPREGVLRRKECYHFALTKFTLLGFSLGGGLVIRAAAREPRISRVIAMDVCTSLFEAATQGFSASGLSIIAANSGQIPATVVNAAVEVVGKSDLLTEWVIAQGKRVMDVATPACPSR
jgi:pimeloyl-ACP methyl ester carboxylesterase